MGHITITSQPLNWLRNLLLQVMNMVLFTAAMNYMLLKQISMILDQWCASLFSIQSTF